jgi:hypothetical protein
MRYLVVLLIVAICTGESLQNFKLIREHLQLTSWAASRDVNDVHRN